MNISSLTSETKDGGRIRWVDPREVTGLPSKSEVLEMERSGSWDESLSDELYDYVVEWFNYSQSHEYSDDGNQKSPIERYVDAMLYIFSTYHNSVAGLLTLSPDQIDATAARKCLPIFETYLAREDLSTSEKSIIRMYFTDFYQVGDLWSSPNGRFYNELSEYENNLISRLAK